jgi:hypothetical protein
MPPAAWLAAARDGRKRAKAELEEEGEGEEGDGSAGAALGASQRKSIS